MIQEINYPSLLKDVNKRVVIAKSIILKSIDGDDSIVYVGAMGSFWMGGKNPFDIDLLVAVTGYLFEPSTIIKPLNDFGLKVDLHVADQWVSLEKRKLETLQILMRKRVNIYGDEPKWLPKI